MINVNNTFIKNSAVALGSFDGVHLGHRAVISRAVSIPELVPKVFTFASDSEKPKSKDGLGSIFSENQKFNILRNLGVQEIVAPNFSDCKNMSGEEFFRTILLDQCGAKALCCGEDFRFGKYASCGVPELKAMCEKNGIDLFVLPLLYSGSEPISSSRIRKMLLEGNIKGSEQLLGRKYYIEKSVVYGAKLGRTFNFPTINQPFEPYRLVPRFGVYASAALIDGKLLPAVTNIGCKPTVSDDPSPLAETYIHGFSGDLYGQVIDVLLFDFLRPERKFSSLDDLRSQIAQDAKTALKISSNAIATL